LGFVIYLGFGILGFGIFNSSSAMTTHTRTTHPRARINTFTHEAMNTVFNFHIHHADARYARQAAQAAFAEVDRLEKLLSRFVEGSDVWRINHAADGESVTISEDTHACLRHAALMTAATQGAFNATLGEAADIAKQHAPKKAPAAPLRAALKHTARALVSLSENSFVARVERGGFSLDLGAIGKGFALDRARALLAEWEIKNALLSAGGSSVLAIGTGPDSSAKRGRGWLVNIAGAKQKMPLTLRDNALGASGTSEQGRHIIDPRRGTQNYAHARVWSLAPDAATADALSTACMTMTPREIARALRVLGNAHAAMTEDAHGKIRHLLPGSARVPRAGLGVPPKPSRAGSPRSEASGGTPDAARETRALPGSQTNASITSITSNCALRARRHECVNPR